jgi:predicted nucleic acid-binding protein
VPAYTPLQSSRYVLRVKKSCSMLRVRSSQPFDSEAARAYGRIDAAVLAVGQKPRGGRAVDFFLAAKALSRGLHLITRNAADFTSVANLVEVVSV